MTKTSLLGLTAAIFALAVPAGAMAAQSGTDCDYAHSAGNTGVGTGSAGGNQLYVYTGNGSSGVAGTTAVGACADVLPGNGTFEGGLAEIGTGGPGSYAVIDGNDNNTGQLAGYGALSNFETGSGGCNQGTGGSPDGSNGGGCVGLKPVGLTLPIPLIACGDTSGKDWNDTARNGCFIP